MKVLACMQMCKFLFCDCSLFFLCSKLALTGRLVLACRACMEGGNEWCVYCVMGDVEGPWNCSMMHGL